MKRNITMKNAVLTQILRNGPKYTWHDHVLVLSNICNQLSHLPADLNRWRKLLLKFSEPDKDTLCFNPVMLLLSYHNPNITKHKGAFRGTSKNLSLDDSHSTYYDPPGDFRKPGP